VREFTKAVLSYGWASTMFQVQQLANVFTTNPETGNSAATDAYNELAGATAQQLSPAMQATYRVGDAMQRSMVNMMFGAMGSSDSSDCRESRQPREVGAPRQPLRPSWRDPARADFRRPPAGPPKVGPQPVAAGPIDTRAAVQGWGPMP
jgi:hypothetical protein